MTTQLISAIYFLIVSAFGLYSMYKNDDVVTNRWLFLCGWFMWGCMMTISVHAFLDYYVTSGYLSLKKLDTIYQVFTDIAHSSISTFTYSIAFIFYSMYLFSLRKRCMEADLIPRTFRIWIIRAWRRVFKRNLYHKRKKK